MAARNNQLLDFHFFFGSSFKIIFRTFGAHKIRYITFHVDKMLAMPFAHGGVKSHAVPFIARFVVGRHKQTSSTALPIPVFEFFSESLSPRELDFFVQCYDYLSYGVNVPPPLSARAYFSSLKSLNTFGSARGRTALNDCHSGVSFDLLFLPGSLPYLGWFYSSSVDVSWSRSLCEVILDLWRHKAESCLDIRYTYYNEAMRRQYRFQTRKFNTKASSLITEKDIHALHFRHTQFIRSLDSGAGPIVLFARVMSGDTLNLHNWKDFDLYPSTRAVEILMRCAMKKWNDLSSNNKLLEEIHQSCYRLGLPWWKPFEELIGVHSAPSTTDTSVSEILSSRSNEIHCCLYRLALSVVSGPPKTPEPTIKLVSEEMDRLSSELSAHEHRVLSQMGDFSFIPDIDKRPGAGVGLLDDFILRYPFLGEGEEEGMGYPVNAAECGHAVGHGWMASMGLDTDGYLSFALRACDMLCSFFGAVFHTNRTPFVSKLLTLRHQLLAHHVRRYGLGSTGVWAEPDSAMQCFPFYESVSLSLQVRSAISILHFTNVGDSHSIQWTYPRSFFLLSLLYPKLTPSLLFCGTTQELYGLKGPQLPCRAGEHNGLFPLTNSQLEELRRQVRLQESSAGSIRVGALMRDGALVSFFNADRDIPIHHIS